MFFSAPIAALLVSAAAAAPAARQAPAYPPHSLGTSFRLIANVTSADLSPSINDYVLTSYHLSAGGAAAVLAPFTTPTTGRLFYLNGTAEDVRYRRASILTSGGTPPFPNGLVLSPQAAPDDTDAPHNVYINAGPGTPGVQLAQFPTPVPVLVGPTVGSYYACSDATLPYGAAIALYYRCEDDALPEGCAAVNLLPQCAEGDGAEHEFANAVPCYDSVKDIDWSVYSA